jgi:hypothetical protein
MRAKFEKLAGFTALRSQVLVLELAIVYAAFRCSVPAHGG